jgi:hypothetical protein
MHDAITTNMPSKASPRQERWLRQEGFPSAGGQLPSSAKRSQIPDCMLGMLAS